MATTSVAQYGYDAGIYEQSDSGWRLVRWSRHQTQAAAERAARSYARSLWANSGPTGGAYSWSAWWRPVDGRETEVTRIPRSGEV